MLEMTTVTRDIHEIFCMDCGYDLRGIASDKCPECGAALDREKLAQSRLPWLRRAAIGRDRAYLRTLWMAIRRPRELADEIARPVSLSDANAFRRMTVIIAMIGPMALTGWLYTEYAQAAPRWPVLPGSWTAFLPKPVAPGPAIARHATIGWILDAGVLPVLWLGLWMFLSSASRVASLWFHPPGMPMERANRAVAISYYACAPLALTPLAMGALMWLTLRLSALPSGLGEVNLAIGLIIAITVIAAIAVAAIQSPVMMMRRATQGGEGRKIAMALTLPVAWATLAAIFVVAMPAAYLFVALVVMSFLA